jgi:hypothetical protein
VLSLPSIMKAASGSKTGSAMACGIEENGARRVQAGMIAAGAMAMGSVRIDCGSGCGSGSTDPANHLLTLAYVEDPVSASQLIDSSAVS